MKPVALFDFDNTLYNGFSLWAVLERQIADGLIDQTLLDSANRIMDRHKSDGADYETTIADLLDAYADGLRGVDYQAAYRSAHQYYRGTEKIYAYAKPVLDLLRPTHDLWLVTGEPQFIAAAITDLLGFKGYMATQYETVEGAFTGQIVSRLATRHEKRQAIRTVSDNLQVGNSLAFGDSEGDIEMLKTVSYPICVNPNPGLRRQALQNGWAIVTERQVETLVGGLLTEAGLPGND